MSKQLSSAEANRLARVARNKEIVSAMREGRDSAEVSSGSFNYKVVSTDAGVSQIVRTNKKNGKVKNMGVCFGVVNRGADPQ